MAKKLYAARDFNDAGTGASFKSGDDITSAPGIDNYVAAGLATEDAPQPGTAPTPTPFPTIG